MAKRPAVAKSIPFYHMTEEERRTVVKLAAFSHGPPGLWLYEAFDVLNRLFWNDRIPVPWIQWGLTPYGHGVGLCGTVANHVPVVTIHPVMKKRNGEGDIIAVFLHELIHVVQRFEEYDGTARETSHNSSSWVSEINRLSPTLGIPAFHRRIVVTNRERRPAVQEPTATAPTPAGFKQSTLATWPHGSFDLIGVDANDAMIQFMDRNGVPRLDDATHSYKLLIQEMADSGLSKIVGAGTVPVVNR